MDLFIEVNPKFSEMMGLPIKDIIGKVKTTDFYRDLSQQDEVRRTLAQDGIIEQYEIAFIYPDGRSAFYSLSARLFLEEGYVEGYAIDISARKKTEALLQESEERFRTLADLLPEAVFEADTELILTYGNKRAFELYGYTEKDFEQGLSCLSMVVPEEHEKVLQNVVVQFEGGKKHSTEYLSV